MANDKTPISRSTAAKVEGISRQYLDKLVAQRRLPTDARKRVTLENVRKVRTEDLDPSRGKHKAAAATSDELTARTAVWMAHLELVELFGIAMAEDRRRWLKQFGITADQATLLAAHVALMLAMITDEVLSADVAPGNFMGLLDGSEEADALFAAADKIRARRKAGVAR